MVNESKNRKVENCRKQPKLDQSGWFKLGQHYEVDLYWMKKSYMIDVYKTGLMI